DRAGGSGAIGKSCLVAPAYGRARLPRQPVCRGADHGLWLARRYTVNNPASANANHRRTRRRRPKNHTKVTCHKGPFGLGPNVAVSMLDVSEAGIRLVVKVPLDRG